MRAGGSGARLNRDRGVEQLGLDRGLDQRARTWNILVAIPPSAVGSTNLTLAVGRLMRFVVRKGGEEKTRDRTGSAAT